MSTMSRHLIVRILIFLYCVNEYNCKHRVVDTKNGPVSGMLFPFRNQGLPTIEVFRGFRYGAVLNRFDNPFKFEDTWKKTKLLTGGFFLFTCYQPFHSTRSGSVNKTSTYKNRLRSLEPYVLRQGEDCLSMNLFVPITGKSAPPTH